MTPSSAILGESDAQHLGAPVPLAGMAGDQPAATFGQACHAPGTAKNTYGTGCFLLLNHGRNVDALRQQPADHARLAVGRRGAGLRAGRQRLRGGAGAVQWLRDELGLIGSAEESAALAASVPDSGGVIVVPAFTGLGAPWWDAYARGAVLGLTRGSGRAELVRATLESIAFQSRDVADAMSADAGLALQTLRVDGGAAANDFLMQFQADILGVPVQRPAVTETTALGAAYLAGLAVGFWAGSEEIAAQWREERGLRAAHVGRTSANRAMRPGAARGAQSRLGAGVRLLFTVPQPFSPSWGTGALPSGRGESFAPGQGTGRRRQGRFMSLSLRERI